MLGDDWSCSKLPCDIEDPGVLSPHLIGKYKIYGSLAPPILQGFLPFGLHAIWEQMAVEVASRGVRTTTMIKQNEMKTQHYRVTK